MNRTEKQVSAGVVVYRMADAGHQEYLLIQHATETQHWDFPKGKVEPGETLYEAALREVHEETGLTVIVDTGFEETISYAFTIDDRCIEKEVHFFVGRVTAGQLVLSDEHDDAIWLPVEAAFERLTYPTARELLDMVHRFVTCR